jgi:glutaredoxin
MRIPANRVSGRRAALAAEGLLLCAVMAGCGRTPQAPDAAPRAREPDASPFISVQEGRGLLFTFFDDRAEMRTVDGRGQVAVAARAEVMVTDPTRRLPADTIYVADLRQPGSRGQFRVWMEPRGTWLDRVMPKTSLLPQPAVAPPAKAEPQRSAAKVRRIRRAKRAAPPQQASVAAKPKVILFGTTWCPSCRAAKQYFQSRRVPFLDLDVEKDPDAARQFQAVQAAFRLRAGAIPVIVINGRPLVGFSRPQVDAALAAMGG